MKSYSFSVDAPNFKNNMMFGGTFKSNFKNLDITRKEVNPMFVAPGRRHFSGYKILSYSSAKGGAFSFTEPVFPLAGFGIFANITSKATKDIFGNPVNLVTSTNIGADNGPGESATPALTSFEAESAFTSGGAEVTCENASGGKAMNVTTEGKSLTFDTVTIAKSDMYLIQVYYLNPTLSNLKMTINEGDEETITLPYTDGFCYQGGNPTSFHFVRTLNSGINTIKFAQGVIDKMEIVSVNNATLGLKTNLLESGTEAYLKSAVISGNDDVRLILKNKVINSRDTAEFSVFDITGKLLLKQNFYTNEISVSASLLGTGLKIITIKIGSELIVKKLIVY
jgi:hypothetical protein